MVTVDGDVAFRVHDCVVVFPKHFTVRKYGNDLNYTLHKVIRYYTSNPQTYVYCMMRSSQNVTVRIDSENIVALNDRIDNPKYIHFPHTTHIPNIVCEMLTTPKSLVVLESSSKDESPTLF